MDKIGQFLGKSTTGSFVRFLGLALMTSCIAPTLNSEVMEGSSGNEEEFAVALRDAPDGGSEGVLKSLTASFPDIFQASVSADNLRKMSIWNDEVSTKLKTMDLSLNVMPPENLLISAPISVVLIGYLVLVGNVNNFKLESATRPQFITQTYFMTAALEVRGAAIKAFNEADESMRGISTLMSQVPYHSKNIAKTVLLRRPDKLAILLKPSLAGLQSIVTKAVELAKAPVEHFTHVQNMLGELNVMVGHTKSVSVDMMKQLSRQLDVTYTQYNNSKRIMDNMNAKLAELQEDRKKQREAFDAAIKAIPTGWEGVAMDVVRSIDITAIIKAGLQTAASIISPLSLIGTVGASVADKLADALASGTANVDISDSNVADAAERFSGMIQKSAATLKENASDLSGYLQTVGKSVELLKMGIQNSKDSKQKDPLDKILSSAVSAVSAFIPSADPKPLFDTLQGLRGSAEVIAKAFKLREPNLQSPRGLQEKTANEKTSNAGNEKFIAEVQTKQLQRVEDRYDAHYQNVLAYAERVNTQLEEIVRFTGLKENHEAVINSTVAAMDAIKLLTSQWANLLLFFQSLSKIIEFNLANEIGNYVGHVNTVIEIAGGDPNGTLVDTLSNDVNLNGQRVEIVSQVIGNLADVYGEISQKYVKQPLIEVGAMAGDVDVAKAALTVLGNGARTAMVGIKEICKKAKDKLHDEVGQQLKKIEMINALTGPMTAQQLANMNAAVSLENEM